jgi:hypothetical protein
LNASELENNVYRKNRTYWQNQALVRFLKQAYLEDSSNPDVNLLHLENGKILQAFLKLAEGNSVDMALILTLNSEDNLNSCSINDHRMVPMVEKTERFRHQTMDLMRILIQRFERENLPILTIKSFLPIPYADSNIDVVVVNNNNLTAYQKILEKIDFHKLTQRTNRTDFREPKKKMYAYSGDIQYPQIHLHRAISWNGIDYLDLAIAWDRRRSFEVEDFSIPIPSPEDEVLIMAAHSIFENKYITIGELIHLSTLMSEEFDWDYTIRQTEIYHWSPALSLWLKTVDTLCNRIDLKVEIPECVYDKMSVKESSTVFLSDSEQFPYVYPRVSIVRVLFNKLISDILAGNLKQLPRQLFSYSIVDLVWAYRNALRKRLKSNILFDRWGTQ